MQERYLGWEKVSFLERCPQFRGVLIEGFHCIYMYIGIYPALMYAVMFYVILNKRKRLGDCVTYFVSIRARALWHIP